MGRILDEALFGPGRRDAGELALSQLDHIARTVDARIAFGPAGQQLGTTRDAAPCAMLPPVDYPVGIIAGNRSIDPMASAFLLRPHDGRVSVENTKLDGMADHIVIATSHPWLPRNRLAIEQTIAFLRDGKFRQG